MKKSTFLLLSLIVLLCAGFLLFSLILKKQYGVIDKTDEFWEFKLKKDLNFSNINVDGGNSIYFSIVNKPENEGIMYKEEFNDYIDYNIKNDTLFIKINKKSKKIKLKSIRKKDASLIIFYDTLKSLIIKNSFSDISLKNQKKINIILNGKSDIEVKSIGENIDSLSINTYDSSILMFNSKCRSFNIDHLSLIVSDSSYVSLINIVPDKTFLKLNDNARAILNSNIVNSLSIESK
ncbi:hypothetical protein [Gillisia sp. Hel_I_29]|uniref:hypothetical protein n=1 Tax=Gillisia sp. Hel_I_29 TaxID=1249975 RepID=UPI0005538E24|nr:hypothetical protein [Gillisia sp. Hel_I_29]